MIVIAAILIMKARCSSDGTWVGLPTDTCFLHSLFDNCTSHSQPLGSSLFVSRQFLARCNMRGALFAMVRYYWLIRQGNNILRSWKMQRRKIKKRKIQKRKILKRKMQKRKMQKRKMQQKKMQCREEQHAHRGAHIPPQDAILFLDSEQLDRPANSLRLDNDDVWAMSILTFRHW